MSSHNNENYARLKPDVLAALAAQARAENKTSMTLLDEAARGWCSNDATSRGRVRSSPKTAPGDQRRLARSAESPLP